MRTLRLVLLLALAALPAQGLDCEGPEQSGEQFELELVDVVIDNAPSDDRGDYEGATFYISNEVASYPLDGRTHTIVFSGARRVYPGRAGYRSVAHVEYYPTWR